MKITIPTEMYHELETRLEESGAYNEADDRYPLYQKVRKGRTFEADVHEIEELKYQAQQMIEIAEENIIGEITTDFERDLQSEANGAAVFLKKLKALA